MPDQAVTAVTEEIRLTSYGVLNADPLIVHVNWYADDVFAKIDAISERFIDRRLIVLVGMAWSVVFLYRDGTVQRTLRRAAAHRTRHPSHRVIFLANDVAEEMVLRQLGAEAVLFQHNAFQGGDLPPLDDTAKRYDAIYVAGLHDYKRVELMRDIRHGCLVYGSRNRAYCAEVLDAIRHLDFPNGDPGGDDVRVLARPEVLALCRRAHVGLCLSWTEGAMSASMEYLLSGIPVVSTAGLGGRETLADPQTWFTCDATAERVAARVAEVKAMAIPAARVQSLALARIMQARVHLTRYLAQTTDLGGGSLAAFCKRLLDTAAAFSRPMLTLSEFLDQIAAAR